MEENLFRSTTVLSVRREGAVAMGGDGQVTLANAVVKSNAAKIRRLGDGKVLAGFAGGAADAIALFERFEGKLEQFKGNLQRAVVELAKDWRTDRSLRRLEALLVVSDLDHTLLVSGSGEVIEPDDGLLAIGSGGPMALAAARSLIKHSNLSAEEIVREALTVTAEICIYTNANITTETLSPESA